MKSRVLTVPKDQEALKLLDYDQATPDILLEYSLDEHEFTNLWECGFFL